MNLKVPSPSVAPGGYNATTVSGNVGADAFGGSIAKAVGGVGEAVTGIGTQIMDLATKRKIENNNRARTDAHNALGLLNNDLDKKINEATAAKSNEYAGENYKTNVQDVLTANSVAAADELGLAGQNRDRFLRESQTQQVGLEKGYSRYISGQQKVATSNSNVAYAAQLTGNYVVAVLGGKQVSATGDVSFDMAAAKLVQKGLYGSVKDEMELQGKPTTVVVDGVTTDLVEQEVYRKLHTAAISHALATQDYDAADAYIKNVEENDDKSDDMTAEEMQIAKSSVWKARTAAKAMQEKQANSAIRQDQMENPDKVWSREELVKRGASPSVVASILKAQVSSKPTQAQYDERYPKLGEEVTAYNPLADEGGLGYSNLRNRILGELGGATAAKHLLKELDDKMYPSKSGTTLYIASQKSALKGLIRQSLTDYNREEGNKMPFLLRFTGLPQVVYGLKNRGSGADEYDDEYEGEKGTKDGENAHKFSPLTLEVNREVDFLDGFIKQAMGDGMSFDQAEEAYRGTDRFLKLEETGNLRNFMEARPEVYGPHIPETPTKPFSRSDIEVPDPTPGEVFQIGSTGKYVSKDPNGNYVDVTARYKKGELTNGTN